MRLSLVILLLSISFAFAHKPFFPEGDGPFAIRNAVVSQAHYLTLNENEIHTFYIPTLTQTVPLQVLVLDNELGRSLDIQAVLSCKGESRLLEKADQAFYEEFSKINHRYKVLDFAEANSSPCELQVSEASGKAGPYTFSIGIEEKFDLADVVGLFSLNAKLNAWQESN